MINVINARPKMIDLSNLHGIELEKARGFNTACVHWEAYDKDREKLVPLDRNKVSELIKDYFGYKDVETPVWNMKHGCELSTLICKTFGTPEASKLVPLDDKKLSDFIWNKDFHNWKNLSMAQCILLSSAICKTFGQLKATELVQLDVGQVGTILSFLLGEYREKGLYENYPHNFNRLIPEFSKDFCQIFGTTKASVPSVEEVTSLISTIIHSIRAFASYGIGASIHGDGVDNIHLQRAIISAKQLYALLTAKTQVELKDE